MTRPYFVDDIFVGIFYHFPEGTTQFRHDSRKMQEFFYERQHRFSVLDTLGFRDRGFYHECQSLNQGYSNMTASGILFSWGNNFHPHEIRVDAVKRLFELDGTNWFTKSQVKQLEELSKEFLQVFGLEAEAATPDNKKLKATKEKDNQASGA